MLKRLTIAVLLSLVVALPASGIMIIWEKSSGKILATARNSRKVELYMRAKIIPAWYGESNRVAVLDSMVPIDSIGRRSLPDSVVWYNYSHELSKIGIVEILPDSAARKIIRDPAPVLKISGGRVDSVRLARELIRVLAEG